jgi:4-diphosphocytidyl-2-C-methyl-D-erythritol kinase
LVLVCPRFGCSTAQVYAQVQAPQQPLDGSALRAALAACDVAALGRHLHNRLEPAAQRVAPQLRDMLERLRALGPAGALMSGSGSSLFAVCLDRAEAERIARQWRRADQDSQVFVTRTCSERLASVP